MAASVNLWIGSIKSKRDFDAYIEESYGDDDPPISPFAVDQGETFYDHDFMEMEYFSQPQDLAEALMPFSFSSGYIDAALMSASGLTPNCIFMDFDGQFEAPQSVEREGISIVFLGRFEFDEKAKSVAEIEREARALERAADADIFLTVRSGQLIYQGDQVNRIAVAANKGLIIGKGVAPEGKELLDLGERVPGIADSQAEIRYSPEKLYWEISDLASNGLTLYRKEPLNGETVAPFNGIRFSFGDVEFDWSVE